MPETMSVPQNNEALTVEKLKRDNETMQQQIEGFQNAIAANINMINALTPLGIWEDIEMPPLVNPASEPYKWDKDLVITTP